MSIAPGHYRGRRPVHLQGTPTKFGATSIPVVMRPKVEDRSPRKLREAQAPAQENSLKASAMRITRDASDKTSGAGYANVGGTNSGNGVQVAQWQEDAWSMYDLVGEQRYLATTLANQLGKARLFVGKRSSNGEGLIEDDLPDEVLATFEAFGGNASGRSQIVVRLGVNLFIAGDGWLVGIPPRLLDPENEDTETEPHVPALRPVDRTTIPDEVSENDALRVAAKGDDSERLVWRMLSVNEVSANEDDIATLRLPENGGTTVEAPLDELYLIRVWRPHPRHASEADSPTRASLPVLRELVGLSMHVSAQVDSRLAGAGLLTIPQSVSQSLARSSGLPEDADVDMVTEALMTAMETAIKNRDSAAAIVPLVLTVPDDAAGKIDHITFSTPLDSEARNLRDEAIRRLALSQDAPPEVLLGTGDMNHWGAWLVQQETVSTHLEPPLALICDALTTEYLQPVLEAKGVPDFDQYVVGYDTEALVSSPTRAQDAQNAYDMGVINDRAVREALGFEESDAPFTTGKDAQPLSPARVLAYEMVKENPALMAAPGLGALVDSLDKLLSNKPLDPTPIGTDAPQAPSESEPDSGSEPSSVPVSTAGRPRPASGGGTSAPASIGAPDLGPDA